MALFSFKKKPDLNHADPIFITYLRVQQLIQDTVRKPLGGAVQKHFDSTEQLVEKIVEIYSKSPNPIKREW